jgi:hypothetical protein
VRRFIQDDAIVVINLSVKPEKAKVLNNAVGGDSRGGYGSNSIAVVVTEERYYYFFSKT